MLNSLDIDPGVGSWRHFEVFTNWNFNETVFTTAAAWLVFNGATLSCVANTHKICLMLDCKY